MGRAAGLGTGIGGQGTCRGDGGTRFEDQGIFIQGRDRRIWNLYRHESMKLVRLLTRTGCDNYARNTYDGDTIIVNVSLFMQLFLDLSVFAFSLANRSIKERVSQRPIPTCSMPKRGIIRDGKTTYCTPAGCKVVLLTVLETIMVRSDEEW